MICIRKEKRKTSASLISSEADATASHHLALEGGMHDFQSRIIILSVYVRLLIFRVSAIFYTSATDFMTICAFSFIRISHINYLGYIEYAFNVKKLFHFTFQSYRYVHRVGSED